MSSSLMSAGEDALLRRVRVIRICFFLSACIVSVIIVILSKTVLSNEFNDATILATFPAILIAASWPLLVPKLPLTVKILTAALLWLSVTIPAPAAFVSHSRKPLNLQTDCSDLAKALACVKPGVVTERLLQFRCGMQAYVAALSEQSSCSVPGIQYEEYR